MITKTVLVGGVNYKTVSNDEDQRFEVYAVIGGDDDLRGFFYYSQDVEDKIKQFIEKDLKVTKQKQIEFVEFYS